MLGFVRLIHRFGDAAYADQTHGLAAPHHAGLAFT